MNNFSYQHYIKLIRAIQNIVPLKDFSEIKERDQQFFLLRHDVEFSVEKAYELAKLEYEDLGITSSYFFQIRNYTYNPLAFRNSKLIKEIHAMGHKIGLHVNSHGLASLADMACFISNEVELLQSGLNLPIDRFSFHRPTHDLLKSNLKIDGLINAYDKKFFHFYEKDPPPTLNVYYFSDSEHRWKFGDPLSILDKPIKKIQLLIHPYSWSSQGMDNTNNFKELIKLKETLMLKAMSEECKHFPNECLE